MPNDEDDYGRRRDADHLYATLGNAAAPPKEPTRIEKALQGIGMPQKEIGETATAIVKLMGRMTDDPLPQQQKMVETFMGRYANPDAVTAVTEMALGEVKGPQAAASSFTTTEKKSVGLSAPQPLKR